MAFGTGFECLEVQKTFFAYFGHAPFTGVAWLKLKGLAKKTSSVFLSKPYFGNSCIVLRFWIVKQNGRQSAILDPISTNIELGLDIGPSPHWTWSLSINSFKRYRLDIIKLPSLHNLFLHVDLSCLWPWKVGQIKNLHSIFKSVSRCIHP
jgi:hypothetical protein